MTAKYEIPEVRILPLAASWRKKALRSLLLQTFLDLRAVIKMMPISLEEKEWLKKAALQREKEELELLDQERGIYLKFAPLEEY